MPELLFVALSEFMINKYRTALRSIGD